jgi:hypothetical protein
MLQGCPTSPASDDGLFELSPTLESSAPGASRASPPELELG